ncbi:conserved hypothetical protein [Dehalogenimonas lykanthroporepellens BL-DC-9]|jgi:hypothetical protein|nr:conserved hypothetical protein [Dehalogenimonas lykanthroporepellens BL-DC-9]
MRKSFSTFIAAIFLILSFPVSTIMAWSPATWGTTWDDFGEDVWYKYDSYHASGPWYSEADFPVTMVFYGPGASKSAAKDTLWYWTGSYLYFALNDTGSWTWDQDQGRKSNPILDQDAWHVRLYANNGNYMYNTAWGKYVLATTHRDWLGCPDMSKSGYGWSEDAEQAVRSKAAETVGWGNIKYNYFNMYNAEDFRVEGAWTGFAHVWQSNGYLTGVYMP